MQRKYAFLIAGFFTALVTSAAVAASGLAGANAAPPAAVVRQSLPWPRSPARKARSLRGKRCFRPN